MIEKIRLMLVDDQILFVESLKTVIEVRTEDIDVVGVAHSGEEALALIAETRPDIVLLDVRMPGMDGVQAARIIGQRHPTVRVMMLTTFDDDEYVHEALAHGAVGYMLKNLPPNDLISSVRAVMAGTIQVSPAVMEKLLREERSTAVDEPAPELRLLSRREREILYLLSFGNDNLAIARRLFLAEQTVKNHISHIYAKLNVHDRFDALLIAQRLQLDRICAYLDVERQTGTE